MIALEFKAYQAAGDNKVVLGLDLLHFIYVFTGIITSEATATSLHIQIFQESIEAFFFVFSFSSFSFSVFSFSPVL